MFALLEDAAKMQNADELVDTPGHFCPHRLIAATGNSLL
jgi:hypothetical protein